MTPEKRLGVGELCIKIHKPVLKTCKDFSVNQHARTLNRLERY